MPGRRWGGETEDALAADQGEVIGGIVDTEFDAEFPASVLLRTGPLPNGDRITCSGTLVSPRWVLTAAHCVGKIDDGTHRAGRTWTVYVSPHGDRTAAEDGSPLAIARAERTFVHTQVTSGFIPYHDAPTQPDENRDKDLALVRLDERVPHPIGLPARVPTENSCFGSTGEFPGKLVGFGLAGFDELVECPDAFGSFRRRMGPSWVPWRREVEGDAAVYVHTFTAPEITMCSDMVGLGVNGDSGGSLYRIGSPPTICGVISGEGHTDTGITDGVAYSHYHTSAVDHPLNLAWMAPYITDADGWFDEHHEPRFNEDPDYDDDDGDGVANRWDNCRTIWNPEQLTEHDDAENDGVGDGLGAACDHCPDDVGGENSPFVNVNYEVELAMARRAGLVEPINPDDFPSTIHFQQARAAWVAAFRPDVCDPTPVPLQSLVEGELPPNAAPAPPAGCGGAFGCTTVVRNQIKVDGRTTPEIPAGTNATIGFRFCDCKAASGANTETIVGRTECANNQAAICAYNPSDYTNSSSRWRRIRTPAGSSWTPTTDIRQWVHPPETDFATFWDFRALGSAVTTTSSSQSVKGVLWATTRQLNPPVAALPTADVEAFAATLGTGDAYWKHQKNTPRTLWYTRDWLYCPVCPQGLQNPYHEVGNPDWRAIIENGSMPVAAPGVDTVRHYEQVAAGTVVHVPASEPLQQLARSFSGGTAFVRSLGLEGSNVTRVLRSSGLDALPSRVAFAATGNLPGRASSRGYAFSATKQRLFSIGGVQVGGTAPLNEGWMLDLQPGTWRRFPFPSGETVGAVLAAVYRHEDQAVYFLDREGTGLRLRRWNAQRRLTSGVVQTLATFSAAWAAFAKFDLSVTPDGRLLFTGWGGTGTEKTRYGLLYVTPANVVSLGRILKSTAAIVDPPATGGTGFTSAQRATGAPEPHAVSITYGAMVAPTSTELPVITPH